MEKASCVLLSICKTCTRKFTEEFLKKGFQVVLGSAANETDVF